MTPKEYAAFYRAYFMTDLLPFWEDRCIDRQCGGYLTCFDRTGALTDSTKYVWFQARTMAVFSYVYHFLDHDNKWLQKAKHGLSFMVDHCYAGNGRWYYRLDRQGRVLDGTISIYSDELAISSLSAYLAATDCQDQQAMDILKETYHVYERNMLDPDFREIYENTWSPKFTWNDLYLASLNAANCASAVLPAETVRSLQTLSMDKILYEFARDEYQMLFEAIQKNGKPDLSEPAGRFINPGHAFESVWMCLRALEGSGDTRRVCRALEIIDWMIEKGWDNQFGGIFAYLDAEGGEPIPLDWHKETHSTWDEKIFWVNVETLHGLAAAYRCSGQKKYFHRFEQLHQFCQDYFHDAQYGEWYERLFRDGRVKCADKGTRSKCMGHVERSILAVIRLFEEMDA